MIVSYAPHVHPEATATVKRRTDGRDREGGFSNGTPRKHSSRLRFSVVVAITISLEVSPSSRSLRISGRQGAQLFLVGSNWHPTPVIITNMVPVAVHFPSLLLGIFYEDFAGRLLTFPHPF